MFDHHPLTGTTLCWAAKGGSGTTVVVAALALSSPVAPVIVDLAGDLPAALGLPEPAGPGVYDWLASDTPADLLGDLMVPVDDQTSLLPAGRPIAHIGLERWDTFIDALGQLGAPVIIDAGTGIPPTVLHDLVDRTFLVTRACYLALRRAIAAPFRSHGAVLVDEPGRALRPDDVESALGIPIIARIPIDPAIARAVDAGLLATRLPRHLRVDLGGVA